jgi:outer membrane protein
MRAAVDRGGRPGTGDKSISMRKQLLLGTVLSLLPLVSASAESFEEALAKAYLSNPTLAAERAQLRATDEGLPQAEALRRPTVTGQGEIGAGAIDSNIVGNESVYPNDVQIGVTQPLWTGGRADAAISQAEYLDRAERANLMNTEETVLLQAATAYLDVVRDEALLDLAINNVNVLTKSRDEAKAQVNAGVATKTDLAQAEARLAQGVADQQAAQAALTNSRATYLQIVGDMPGTLTAPAPVERLPLSQDLANEQASNQNPQVLSAQANEQAARAGIDLAEAQLMPSLAVSGQVGHQADQQEAGTNENNAQVLLTLTVPFYQGGAEYAQIRSAKQTYGQSQSQIEAAKRAAIESATAAWQNLQAARANVLSFQSQIDANTIAYAGTVEEQRVGTRTFLDVLNAQQELFTSQSELAIAQHNEAVSAYQLKSAVGEMTALALDLQVERYDPLVHYNEDRYRWFGTGPAVH